MRPIALGRRNWTFAGSDAGGLRAAAIYSLIETAKANDLDPEANLGMSSTASPIIPSTALQNCCPGTSRASASGSTRGSLHYTAMPWAYAYSATASTTASTTRTGSFPVNVTVQTYEIQEVLTPVPTRT
jgi:hypothetical protein